MKNKKKYSKLIMFTLITFGMIILLNVMLYYHVNKNYNNKIVNIISTIKEKYPEIKDDEIKNYWKKKYENYICKLLYYPIVYIFNYLFSISNNNY